MILFVDDERRRMKSYVEALSSSNYQVNFKDKIDEALDVFERDCDKLQLLILDVMMPTRNIFDSEQADDGLRTGVCFYKKIRKDNPNIPIVIFTNFRNNELSSIESDEKTFVFQKDETLPFELVSNIKEILAGN